MLMNKPKKAHFRATSVIEFGNRVEFFQQTLDSDNYLMSQTEWITVVKKTITDSVRIKMLSPIYASDHLQTKINALHALIELVTL